MSIGTRILLLRLTAAIGSSAIFGLVSAPLLPMPHWPSAFFLAFCFGFAFIGGTGYRILVAVAFFDKSRPAPASWSGATAVSAIAAAIGFAAFSLAGLDATVMLAGYALAINAAYVPVKAACLLVGCCPAARPLPFGWRADLRIVEISASCATIVLAAALVRAGFPAAAAVVGLTGHLAVRLLSRWARRRLPRYPWRPAGPGMELAPLALVLVLSVWAGWSERTVLLIS